MMAELERVGRTTVEAREEGDIGILVVEVSDRLYALLLSSVREIHRAVAVVAVPRAPAIVEGIVDVRGEVIPVLNLRSRFRLPLREVEPEDHLIVAWAGDRLVALHVDRAREIARVDLATIEGNALTAAGVDYVAGVARLPDGLVLIHDLATFLSAVESADLGAALDPMKQAPDLA